MDDWPARCLIALYEGEWRKHKTPQKTLYCGSLPNEPDETIRHVVFFTKRSHGNFVDGCLKHLVGDIVSNDLWRNMLRLKLAGWDASYWMVIRYHSKHRVLSGAHWACKKQTACGVCLGFFFLERPWRFVRKRERKERWNILKNPSYPSEGTRSILVLRTFRCRCQSGTMG